MQITVHNVRKPVRQNYQRPLSMGIGGFLLAGFFWGMFTFEALTSRELPYHLLIPAVPLTVFTGFALAVFYERIIVEWGYEDAKAASEFEFTSEEKIAANDAYEPVLAMLKTTFGLEQQKLAIHVGVSGIRDGLVTGDVWLSHGSIHLITRHVSHVTRKQALEALCHCEYMANDKELQRLVKDIHKLSGIGTMRTN